MFPILANGGRAYLALGSETPFVVAVVSFALVSIAVATVATRLARKSN